MTHGSLICFRASFSGVDSHLVNLSKDPWLGTHRPHGEPTSIILLNGHGIKVSCNVVSLLFLDGLFDLKERKPFHEMSAAPKSHQRSVFVKWTIGQPRSAQLAKAREKDTKCSVTDRVYHTLCRDHHRRASRKAERACSGRTRAHSVACLWRHQHRHQHQLGVVQDRLRPVLLWFCRLHSWVCIKSIPKRGTRDHFGDME